jgi:hypothetical protein
VHNRMSSGTKYDLVGTKAAIPLWTKKEHGHHEAGILDPLEDCTLHMKNWI